VAAMGLALFATAIGGCGLAWGPDGIRGVQLPEAGPAATAARLRRRFPTLTLAEPPPTIADTIAQLGALLRGEPVDFATTVLDCSDLGAFERRVYAAAREIPPGATRSYGEIARRIGAPGSARAVGRALGRNPFPLIVPCHRVLAAGGRTGGFSAHGGGATKLRLLALEGAPLLFV
jgi:methylated-DNA-[protein]-cysteine S-methyltransferase